MFTNRPSQALGLITVHSSLSTNLRLVDTKAFSLAVYSDFGVITAFPNPLLDLAWTDAESYLSCSGGPVAPGAKAQLASGSRIVVALGAEVEAFEHAIVSWGLGVPLGSIESDLKLWPLFVPEEDHPDEPFADATLEFEFKYRL